METTLNYKQSESLLTKEDKKMRQREIKCINIIIILITVDIIIATTRL